MHAAGRRPAAAGRDAAAARARAAPAPRSRSKARLPRVQHVAGAAQAGRARLQPRRSSRAGRPAEGVRGERINKSYARRSSAATIGTCSTRERTQPPAASSPLREGRLRRPASTGVRRARARRPTATRRHWPARERAVRMDRGPGQCRGQAARTTGVGSASRGWAAGPQLASPVGARWRARRRCSGASRREHYSPRPCRRYGSSVPKLREKCEPHARRPHQHAPDPTVRIGRDAFSRRIELAGQRGVPLRVS